MKVHVEIRRRPDIADPEGVTALRALRNLGFTNVSDVRFGKIIELEVAAESSADAVSRVEEACRRLLANPVIEDFEVTVP